MNGQSVEQEPKFRSRARHTTSTLNVHQAHRPEIGGPAACTGQFPASWQRDRMTWVIKQRSQPTTTYAHALDRGHLRACLSERGSWSRDEMDEGDAPGRAVRA
ncbi:DUF4291 family protein [Streptomyces sp. NPDC086519]|uniref:DUF4291 family protein n=1 Tax=Streptomyces sp. NPDC086519 TaxID=3154863 RepID=UPI003417A03A